VGPRDAKGGGVTEQYKLVEVAWQDAWADHEESNLKDWRDEQPVSTVGWVVRDTKRVLSIANEILHGDEVHADETTFRCITHIPRPLITRITELREAASPDAPPVQP
jgi:hypothetical protein